MYYKKESNDELKEVYIKNRMCYYFDDKTRIEDFGLDNVLLDEKIYEKSYEKISIYEILCKNFMGAKLLPIRFDKIDGFI